MRCLLGNTFCSGTEVAAQAAVAAAPPQAPARAQTVEAQADVQAIHLQVQIALALCSVIVCFDDVASIVQYERCTNHILIVVSLVMWTP